MCGIGEKEKIFKIQINIKIINIKNASEEHNPPNIEKHHICTLNSHYYTQDHTAISNRVRLIDCASVCACGATLLALRAPLPPPSPQPAKSLRAANARRHHETTTTTGNARGGVRGTAAPQTVDSVWRTHTSTVWVLAKLNTHTHTLRCAPTANGGARVVNSHHGDSYVCACVRVCDDDDDDDGRPLLSRFARCLYL